MGGSLSHSSSTVHGRSAGTPFTATAGASPAPAAGAFRGPAFSLFPRTSPFSGPMILSIHGSTVSSIPSTSSASTHLWNGAAPIRSNPFFSVRGTYMNRV